MKTNALKRTPGKHFQAMLLGLGLLLTTASVWATDGVPVWTNIFDGNGIGSDADEAYAVGVDGSGNVYVTGESVGNNGYTDILTIKYSSNGVPAWTNRYNGLGNAGDSGFALVATSSGEVFVTGVSTGSGTGEDYATIKYSSAGTPIWTNRYTGAGNNLDRPGALAVDGSGNVYVTGNSFRSTSGNDYLTIKYSSAGMPVWTNRFTGAGIFNDGANSLAVDAGGAVFVTGSSYRGLDNTDYATIKYSSTGAPLWTNYFAGAGGYLDGASALALDAAGDVYITGGSHGDANGQDCATIKYSSGGMPVWTNLFTSDEFDSEAGRALAVDGSGAVIVAGYSTGSGSGGDFLIIKYTGAGLPVWTRHYTSPGNEFDSLNSLAVDSTGNVYVTGSSYDNASAENYATIKYSGAGVPVWTNRYNGTGNYWDAPYSLAVDGGGNVYVTGRSVGLAGGLNYATIKYTGGSSVTAIPLSLARVGSQVVLSWTSVAFSLQSAPLITGLFTNIPGATSPYTNAAANSQQFFRLIGN